MTGYSSRDYDETPTRCPVDPDCGLYQRRILPAHLKEAHGV
jgi:hypothetical protein